MWYELTVKGCSVSDFGVIDSVESAKMVLFSDIINKTKKDSTYLKIITFLGNR